MKLLIFHNRSAGSGSTSEKELLGAFSDAGFDVRYSTNSSGPPNAEELADVAVIGIAGGDGTVLKAFRDFPHFRGRFAIVPLGGANNIATSLGIRGSMNDVAQGLARGMILPFRLGVIENSGMQRTFAEGVGCGALAQSLSDAHDRPSGGDKIRAGRQLLAEILADASPLRSQLVVDGRALPDDLLFVEVLNVSTAGPSLPLAASASPADDVMDVAYLPAARRSAFRSALLADERLPVEVVRGREIDFTWRDDCLRIDDDFRQPSVDDRRFRIAPSQRQVEVIIPAVSADADKGESR